MNFYSGWSRSLIFFIIVSLPYSIGNRILDANADDSPNALKVKQTQIVAFESTNLLSPIDEKTGNPDVSKATFDLGTLHATDHNQEYQDEIREEHFLPVLRGYKHTFVLKNNTAKALVITNFSRNSVCLQATVAPTADKFADFPITVPSGQAVNILVAIYERALAPGPFSLSTDLLGEDGKAVLAKLTVTGTIDSGLRFSTEIVSFGHLQFAESGSQEFSLKLDRQIPSLIPQGENLTLISTNPFVQVVTEPLIPDNENVALKGNAIEFVKHRLRGLPQDLTVKYRVTLAKDAPLGTIGGQLRLIVPDFPLYMLVVSSKLQLMGEVLGHMNINPEVLVLGTAKRGETPNKQATITCMPPIKSTDLHVLVSNNNLLVHFVPVAIKSNQARPSQPKTQHVTASNASQAHVKSGSSKILGQLGSTSVDPEDIMELEVALKPDAPPGKQDGQIIVTNGVNAERFEIRVYCTVIP